MPTPLPQISSRAWEHPADRAALNTLRAIPGFDEIVRQVATFLTERRVRQLFLANAVQVNPVQRPKLDALLTDVCTTMDWPKRPELYVTQSPKVNAYAIGYEDPFIVMTSGALELLESDDERRFLLAHELGHIMSDHMTYRTIAMVILVDRHAGAHARGSRAASLPARPARVAPEERVLERPRRAAGAAGQDRRAAARSCVSPAAATSATPRASRHSWRRRRRTRPAATPGTRSSRCSTPRSASTRSTRCAPRSSSGGGTSGEYDAIIAGGYTRRGEKGQGLGDDFSDAARYYSGKANAGMSSVGDALDRAKTAFNDAFRGRDEPPAPPSEPTTPL